MIANVTASDELESVGPLGQTALRVSFLALAVGVAVVALERLGRPARRESLGRRLRRVVRRHLKL